MNIKIIFVFVFLCVCLALGIFGLSQYSILGSKPELQLIGKYDALPIDATKPIAMGKDIPFLLKLQNTKSGICSVEATLKTTQDAIEKSFFNYTNENAAFLVDKDDIKPELTLKASSPLTDLKEDTGTITITAKDCSLFGKTTTLDVPVTIDVAPPILGITSSQHYINQGGAGVVTYSVSADAQWSGVKIGNYTFKGFPKPGVPNNEHFAFFVYSYDLPANTTIEIVARDGAGNEGKSTLIPAKFFPKEFRHRDLPIDDKFIETKVADIIANTSSLKNQGDNLKNYLMVNRDLRKSNNDFIKKLAEKSENHFFWKGAFQPLGNASIEANFADYRSYIYNGEKVDEQVHLGFDMAVLEHYPISASANGKVAFNGYLGIYGNTIIIDHGYGLMSLYAHLSSSDVKEGDVVARGQKIANSGATGLAGGDHLHFSLLIGGVQTNPIEFWDEHWITDNVYLRLGEKIFSEN